jgi:ribonuclease P protein component
MRRSQRLRKRREFIAVYRKGRAFTHEHITLRVLRNQLPCNRFGIVVSKAVGNAVVRNRVRRRLREGLRTLTLEPGWDIVVTARSPAARADYHQLLAAGRALLGRAGLLQEERSTEGETRTI